jgi:hypothetical protein
MNDLENKCIEETLEHRVAVKELIYKIITELKVRAHTHDASKLTQAELPLFSVITPRLKTSTYGSEEYKKNLEELGPAVAHHYEVNPHHPEHFSNGIQWNDK